MDQPQTCQEIAGAVQQGRRSAREVVEQALAEAEQRQSQWPVFITLTPELAERQAHRVDQWLAAGRSLPLAGVPVALKDLIDVQGVRTTCGSRVFGDRFARSNATVVRKLVSAGAVILGKTNLHEFAFGFTGENAAFGNCPNPWDRQRISGGSSSGAALAVALGICPLALGTDTGGSIRVPAAFCGLVGLKPTYGRISRSGVFPLAWSLDHLGPLTRTAEDAALVLRVLAGRDREDRTTGRQLVVDYQAALEKPLGGLKIGLPGRGFFREADPEVATVVASAAGILHSRGATLVEVEVPHLAETLGAHRTTIFAEAAAVHRALLAERGELYEAGLRQRLLAGLLLPAADYLHAQQVRQLLRQAWAGLFATVDCLLMPTTPVTAPLMGQKQVALPTGELSLFEACLGRTLPMNVTGHPAVSIPCGFTGAGLPVGMQLVGRPFDEATILRVAHHYQEQTDWHRQPLPGA